MLALIMWLLFIVCLNFIKYACYMCVYVCVNVPRGSVTRPVEWPGTLQFGIAAKSELSSSISQLYW